jgi:hypothetical protein
VRDAFDAQVETLIRKGYPALCDATEEVFVARLEPLAEKLPAAGIGPDADVAFVIVPRVPRARAVPLVELSGKHGFTDMAPAELERFEPIDGVEPPNGTAYLVADVDTGRDTLNVTPDDALELIVQRKRSPLTLDEGLALVTQFPEILETKNKFSLLGSRCGDRRVTAIWISKGQPRLGWCWAGNPHTWLGSASCRSRIGVAG